MILRSQTSEIRVDKQTKRQTKRQTDNANYYVDIGTTETSVRKIQKHKIKKHKEVYFEVSTFHPLGLYQE